jgi:PKD repeat protein
MSTGDIDEWWWDFGDGETSTERTPAHTYQNEGTYDVTLTVTGPTGTDEAYRANFIIVEAAATPAKLAVRNLNITPVDAQPRQAVAINANVVNEGGSWGSQRVDLLINGQFEQSRNVGVAPGTAQPISFTVYKVPAGEYQVSIGDATGTFYVMEEAAPAPTGGGILPRGELGSGSIIAIIVIGIIVVGGAVVTILLATRS